MDPLLEAAATALATKAVDALADGGRSAWQALVQLVRTRFAADPTAKEALDSARAEPQDEEKVEWLAYELGRAERQDPQFGHQLRRLWDQVGNEVLIESGDVVNKISGTVKGHVVQARDIEGGVAFGPRHPC